MAAVTNRRSPGDSPPTRRASFAQERMWFLESLDPGGAIYNQLNAFRIRGPIDVRLLERSLGEVIARHESLRTNLFVSEGRIYQRILPAASPGLHLVDPRSASPLDDARRLLVESARKPFDLASEPLVRPYLITLAPDDFLLGLITHHTIIDGWSTRILIRELAAIYDDLAQGRTPGTTLPPPAIQYTVYAARQRERFDAGEYDRQLEHWLKVLDGDLPVLALPVDHRRSASQPYEGRAFTLTLPPDMAASLKALGRKEKATLFMVLLAAYNVLMYRYSGQDDIVIGCPVAGRNELDTEGMIGLFVNTLPMRSKISSSDSFLALLRQVKATALKAYDNQDIPFEKLVERLAVPRMLDRSPVFQTLFQLRNFPGHAAALAGYPVERIEFDEVVAKADMTLEITETDNGLMCRFEYPVALFDAPTIERMAGHWRTLLEDIVADPSKEVSRLRILTEEELRYLLALGRGTRNEYPRDATVDGVFEARARASPDSVAIIDGRERITYRELDARANRLARKLRSLGVGAGEPAALLMERSAALVTAMLAILKTGGAYVPLDTGDTDSRIAGILADAGVKVILAGPGLAERAKEWAPHVIGINEALRDDGPADSPPPASDTGPESRAYVMFTSGSTGVPKGVVVRHRGILRLVINTDYVRISPGDVVSHLTSPAFDLSTFDVWGTLLNGATLAIVDRDTALSPAKLRAKIDECGIDIVLMPTPLFHAMAAESPSCFGRVRDLLVCGDVLDPVTAMTVLKNGLRGRLLNVYGPTEITVLSTWYHVKEMNDRGESIPIGRPIANDYLYILDDFRQPVPVGVIGELYLGGDGVSTGYLRRPDLNAAKFLPDPFNADGGRMIYRSGDLGRFLPDGNVQFIGRRDGQAKIHGFRVETGEVAAALESHPAVRLAVVTVFNDPGGFKSLAAYLLKADDAEASIGDIRSYLSGRLPAYMVPVSMMWIDAVPLTPRGKIDRSALSDPTIGFEPDPATRTPGDDGDRALSQMGTVWESVLGAGHVGPDDNFFDLGGHSLLAIRLIDRIEESFGVRLPISVIFKAPTVRKMLASARDAGKDPAGQILVALQAEGTRPPLYCIHAIPGTLFEYDNLVRQIGKDQPVYGVQSPGLDGLSRTPDDVEAMAALYVSVLRGHRPNGPYHLIAYCAGGAIAYEMARQLEAAGETAGFLGLVDYPAPKQATKSSLWSCYRYVRDNMDGAAIHLSEFLHASGRDRINVLADVPGFLVKKVLRLPGEVVLPANPPAARPDARAPEWVRNMPGGRQEVAVKNYEAIASYVPQACGVKVDLFTSTERVRISRRAGNYERTYGWKKLAGGGVRCHVMRGDHASILSPESLRKMSPVIKKCMDSHGRGEDGREH